FQDGFHAIVEQRSTRVVREGRKTDGTRKSPHQARCWPFIDADGVKRNEVAVVAEAIKRDVLPIRNRAVCADARDEHALTRCPTASDDSVLRNSELGEIAFLTLDVPIDRCAALRVSARRSWAHPLKNIDDEAVAFGFVVDHLRTLDE